MLEVKNAYRADTGSLRVNSCHRPSKKGAQSSISIRS